MAKLFVGQRVRRAQAAPMPESPAPTISTSKCEPSPWVLGGGAFATVWAAKVEHHVGESGQLSGRAAVGALLHKCAVDAADGPRPDGVELDRDGGPPARMQPSGQTRPSHAFERHRAHGTANGADGGPRRLHCARTIRFRSLNLGVSGDRSRTSAGAMTAPTIATGIANILQCSIHVVSGGPDSG
jgi:hypothetical protein